MTYRLFSLVILLFVSGYSVAQKGDLFLTHHKLDIEGLDNTNFEIKINQHGQLCIANRSGLLQYDGFNWDYISTPSAALSIDYDDEDNLYVGCVGDFGKIDLMNNELQFVSLNPYKNDEGVYNQTIHLDSNIYFLSEENLIRHNIKQQRSNILYLQNETEFFTKLFEVDGELLVQTNDSLYLYKNDSLKLFEWEKPDDGEIIFFNKHPSEDKYVVGTTDNKTYIYRKGNFYECKVSQFLNENESFVDNGHWLNDRYFALSTLENGCILYDNKNSRIKEVINQSKGLPDNEIQAIGVDHEEGLWISHQFGLTRMEISIPFRSFTNFQGLHGTISEVFFFNKKLYVATSEGVYHLEKENVYKNTVYYTESKKLSSTSTQSKKGKRSRTSKKNSKSSKTTSSSSTTRKKDFVRKVKKEVIESKYRFKAIDGIHSKTEKFIVYQGKLLTAGTNGVYEIKGNHAELVIHAPVRFIEPERKTNRLIIGTLYNEIKLYELENDVWTESEDLNLHGELVMTAFNDQSGRTWFVTPTSLMEFHEFSDDHLTYNTYKYKNQFIDNTKLAYIHKQLYLINSEGYFYLHTGLKEMVEDTVFLHNIGKPIKHLQQRNGIIWVFNGENWFMINPDGTWVQQDKFGLFPNMTYVSKYGSRHWLVNDSKEILQFEPSLDDTLVNHNKIFFRKIRNDKGDIKLTEHLNFEHDENSIHFELSKPDYRGILKPEYQYKLSGANNNWSKWSDNHAIHFPILPPGNYQLFVRTRDSFGNTEEADTVKFTIHPPFWLQPWFLALQIIFMIGLVITSIMMNRRAKSKYVLVTEGLSILTIVMVIEFLQTVASSNLDIKSSPVVDFGIDVVIALFVFPLELALKKAMKVDKTGPGLSGKGILDIVLPKKGKKADTKKKEVSADKTVGTKKKETKPPTKAKAKKLSAAKKSTGTTKKDKP